MKTASCGKALPLLAVYLGCVFSLAAQDTQRFETFGGYSLLHDNNSLVFPTTVFNGWDTSTTVFLNNWLGVTSDFSGHYGGYTYTLLPAPGGTAGKRRLSDSGYTFMFGPHFTYRRSRYAPFAQALFGAFHTVELQATLVPVTCPPPEGCGGTLILAAPDTGFAMAFGGGLDIALGHGISLRPVQADYIVRRDALTIPENGAFPTRIFYFNSFRYSTGITFRFGPLLGKNR